MGKYALRLAALGYLTALLVLPVGLICWSTFKDGVGPVVDALTTPAARHAFAVTAEVAILAVVANTVFGVAVSLLLVRRDFPGKRLLDAAIDVPIAVSPVVVGLALVLVYGVNAPLGGWLAARGLQIIFAVPGMVLATVFVSLPLVVRAVVPVLEEIGTDQEQAAWTLGANPVQTFARITLPAIRWALGYGMVLALARSLGEYGAVAVVSGRLVGRTQTLTLLVEERFASFDAKAAYSVSFAMAVVAVASLLLLNVIRPKEDAR